MANQARMKMKKFGRYVWELFKSSILPTTMYVCAGLILTMICVRGKEITWTNKKLLWTVVCIVGAAGYHAMTAWASGGTQYQMLVTGNVKRSTMDAYGNAYKMSTHKEAKEYRVWKGFASGGFVAIYTVIFSIVLGCNQSAVNLAQPPKWLAIFILISFFFAGWSTVPLYCLNEAGYSVSYFWGLAFALIPIAIAGGTYIAGAYSRRAKAIRQQILAEKAAEAEAAKRANKKINYGGLPGTKPKKK